MNLKLGNAMDLPEKVADKFMIFLTHNNYQKKIGLKESFFIFINKIFPKLTDMAIGKQLPVIKQYLNK
jgi:hypothetical protein